MSIQPNVDERSAVVECSTLGDYSRSQLYQPIAHSSDPFHWSPDQASRTTSVFALAEPARPTHEAMGGQSKYTHPKPRKSAFKEDFERMPRRLLRTADATLVDKTDVWGELQPMVNQVKSQHRWRLASFAILSHRWDEMHMEPTFEDMQGKLDHAKLREKRGFRKLEKFCEVAEHHGCMWAWADTCCIDKSSSAELDEAIRSMYRWYQDAAICIVFLADTVYVDDIKADAWFTRGWTLQELLAPKRVKFFNRDWLPLTPGRLLTTH